MAQARALTDGEDGFLRDKSYLVHDRDAKFTPQFLEILETAGIESTRLPRRSPNLNAYAERFVLSIKTECLNRLILFGSRSLHRALREFALHDHCERNHQGLNTTLLETVDRGQKGVVTCRGRLGGLLKFLPPSRMTNSAGPHTAETTSDEWMDSTGGKPKWGHPQRTNRWKGSITRGCQRSMGLAEAISGEPCLCAVSNARIITRRSPTADKRGPRDSPGPEERALDPGTDAEAAAPTG